MNRVFLRLGLLLPVLLGCAARETEIGDLKTFACKEGRFTADFPGDPVLHEQTTSTVVGNLTVHLYLVQLGGGTAEYMAGYTEVPGTLTPTQIAKFNANKGLDDARDGIARATQSRVTKESNIALGKWPGREWEFAATGPTNEDFRWRVYYVKARQYQISVGWLKGREPPRDVVDAFLNSLKLTAD